jgi:hypothetical protein
MYADVFEPPRVSKLAIAALVCSLLFCLVIPPVIGVILGLWALVALTGKPNVRGRGIAIAAVVLGLCFTTGLVIFGSWGLREAFEFRDFVRDRPTEIFTAGANGDYATFRAGFTEAGAGASDAEVQDFFTELTRRYGTFVSLHAIDPGRIQTPDPDQPYMGMDYEGKFSNGTAPMYVEFAYIETRGDSVVKVKKLNFVDLRDRNQESLRFPPLPPAPTGAGP